MEESSSLKRRNPDLSIGFKTRRRHTRWFGGDAPSNTLSGPRAALSPVITTQLPQSQNTHSPKIPENLPTTPPGPSVASAPQLAIYNIREMAPISTHSSALAWPRVESTDPWTQYEKTLTLLAGCEATLAYRDDKPYLVYGVSGEQHNFHLRALHALSQYHRPVSLHFYEVFSMSAAEMLVVTEYLDVSLADVVGSVLVPSEDQIASILSQILGALSCILGETLLHSDFSARSVLLHADGAAKIDIGDLSHGIAPVPPEKKELNTEDPTLEDNYVTSLNNILVQVMEKDSERLPKGRISLKSPGAWSQRAQAFMRKLAQPSTRLRDLEQDHFVQEAARVKLSKLVEVGRVSSYHWYQVP